MSPAFEVLFALGLLATRVDFGGQAATSSPCQLHGVVESSTDKTRIVSARIVLTSLVDPAIVFQTVSDEKGELCLGKIPAGRYAIRSFKPGWIESRYGGMSTGYLGEPLTVLPDQLIRNLALTLSPGGVIGGTVTSESGEALPGVEIRVLRFVDGVGIENPVSVGNTASKVTDDLGEFRFYGLAPGEYVVAAVPDRSLATKVGISPRPMTAASARGANVNAFVEDPKARVDYAMVFFPSSAEVGLAERIRIAPGTQRLNLALQMKVVNVVSIRGVARPGSAAPGPITINVSLAGTESGGVGSRRTVVANPQGAFEFYGVPPGTYLLGARAMPANSAGRQLLPQDLASATYATTKVVVGRDDVSVMLDLQTGATVSGSFEFRSTSVPSGPEIATAAMGLSSLDQSPLPVIPVVPDEKGRFHFVNVPPGRYRVMPSSPRTADGPWFVEGIRAGDLDLSLASLEVFPGTVVDNIRVAMTRESATIQGKIDLPTGAVPEDYVVIVFPAERNRWGRSSRGLGQARLGKDGRYSIGSLPTGEFFLAVVPYSGEFFVFSPPVLEQVAPLGIRVALETGRTVTQDLKIPGR